MHLHVISLVPQLPLNLPGPAGAGHDRRARHQRDGELQPVGVVRPALAAAVVQPAASLFPSVCACA